jgi:mycothione reductase
VETYDLIVLGGGRAANLAIAASKAGWKTALIERDRLGGTCPNNGCVPSKLLIGFAEAARHVTDAGRHFIDVSYRGIDTAKLFESVNSYIGGVDKRYESRVDCADVTLIRGDGKFTGPKQIEAAGRMLTADKIVIATGARPTPPPFAHLPVWTSDNLFPLRTAVPKSLIIIGGGVIGCEMAAFFSAIGVETTLAVRNSRLLENEDHEIEQVFQKEFTKNVATYLDADLKHLTYHKDEFMATFQTPDGEKTLRAERVLFAIGRTPNSDTLDLNQTSLRANAQGFIPVNEHLETSIHGIYATGDINGRYMLQHAAAYEVHYLREKFLKAATATIHETPMAHAVFSYPEVAAVGLTEQQLIARGTLYVSVCEDWLASARAEALRIEYPRVKFLISPKDYSIFGCHLVGPEASALLHQVITVMRLKNDIREIAETIHIHPALNECLLAAAVKVIGKVRKARNE